MLTRTFLLGTFICGTVLASAQPLAAADEPSVAALNSQSPVWGFLPDETCAGLVVYPERILRSAPHLKGAMDDFGRKMGVSPFEMDQVVVVFGYPQPRRPYGSKQPFSAGAIVRTIKPYGGKLLVARLLSPHPPEQGTIENKIYYRPTNVFGHGTNCVALIDDRTFVVADETDLQAMLTAPSGKTALGDALKTVQAADDATIVVVNRAEIRKLVSAMKDSHALPPALVPISDILPLIDGAKLRITTVPDIALTLSLDARDEVGAGKVLAAATATKQILAATVNSLRDAPLATLPADQKESMDFFVAKIEKLTTDIKPIRSGNRVSIEVGGLGTIDQWAIKCAGPIARVREV